MKPKSLFLTETDFRFSVTIQLSETDSNSSPQHRRRLSTAGGLTKVLNQTRLSKTFFSGASTYPLTPLNLPPHPSSGPRILLTRAALSNLFFRESSASPYLSLVFLTLLTRLPGSRTLLVRAALSTCFDR